LTFILKLNEQEKDSKSKNESLKRKILINESKKYWIKGNSGRRSLRKKESWVHKCLIFDVNGKIFIIR